MKAAGRAPCTSKLLGRGSAGSRPRRSRTLAQRKRGVKECDVRETLGREETAAVKTKRGTPEVP